MRKDAWEGGITAGYYNHIMLLSVRAMCSLRLALFCLCVAIFPLTACAHSPDRAIVDPLTELPPITVGRYTVAWSPGNGLSVAADAVPVVRQSTLYLVKAGWKGTLLDQREVKPVITDWKAATDGPTSAQIALENENAACIYTLSLSHTEKSDVLDVALSYRLKRDIPTEIEYAAGYLAGPLLAGITLNGNVDTDPIPLTEVAVAPPPARNTQEQNRLCPPFSEIDLATRLGILQIAYSGSASHPVLFDARSDPQEWARAFPVFWMGIGSPSQPVRLADGERVARFRFTLSPPPSAAQAGSPENGEMVTRSAILPDAFLPVAPEQPLVIPTPKQMTIPSDGRPFRLNAATKIVRCDDSIGTKRAVTILQQAIEEELGLKLKAIAQSDIPARTVTTEKNTLYVGLTGKSPLLRAPRVNVPQKPEGYGIRLPYVAGRDEAGVLWAVQTAIQLLSSDNSGPNLPSVVISDWPTLALRGAHLFYGQNALPFHKKLIDRVLSRFKMNTLILQVEQVRWQHDPTIAPPWAGTPQQIRQEIAFARERGITIYPLVQNYGHMEWLFTQPKNLIFAEDPAKPYAINFTNPAAVRYLEGFDAEADLVFNAPAFHIGLDEVTMLGRFPYRSAPRAFSSLFVAAATHWHDFFAKRGKQTWMWADMTLHPSEVSPAYGTAPSAKEAAAIRAGLPKDIVLLDWQYSALDRYPSLKKLKDAGFKKVIAATWYNPVNIQNFARAAAKVGAWGGLQTTWCGFESNVSVLETNERRQFTAMVLAAEYFWNGGSGPPPDKLPFDPNTAFARQWQEPDRRDNKARDGWALRLSSIGTRPLDDFIGYGPRNRLADFAPDKFRLSDNTVYEIAERPLVLFGKLNPPGEYAREATIPVRGAPDMAARTVRLLLAASHRTDTGTQLGSILVSLTDGSTITVPIIYGKNLACWEDGTGLLDAPIVWRGATLSDQPAYLRQVSVSAPAGKAISSLKIVSDGRESAPILFAATALE